MKKEKTIRLDGKDIPVKDILTVRPEPEEQKFYLVTVDKVIDGNPEAFPPFLTDNRQLAKRKFHEIKRRIENYGFPVDEERLQTQDKADFMEIYETSDWCRNHYSVELTVIHPEYKRSVMKKKFKVAVTLPLTLLLEVEAEDEIDAIDKARPIALYTPTEQWGDDFSNATFDVID